MIKRNTLKFRAFDSAMNLMICEGFHIIGEVMMFGLIDQHIAENLLGKGSLERYNDIIITQFTGLKDSTQKEIYEGDIVKLNSESIVQEVVFGKLSDGKDKEGVTCFFLDGSRFGNGWVESRFDSKNYEIIGNIFENLKLIK